MKEFLKVFAMKHPLITFLIADSAICGTVNIVRTIAGAFSGPTTAQAPVSVTEPPVTEEDEEEQEEETP